jgi:hypothetical protein
MPSCEVWFSRESGTARIVEVKGASEVVAKRNLDALRLKLRLIVKVIIVGGVVPRTSQGL